eukprot:10222594-Karenia_brevis.AAC.1
MDELLLALRKIKQGKAKDPMGVVAEMIKYGGAALHEAILEVFNDLLLANALIPETWRKTRLM